MGEWKEHKLSMPDLFIRQEEVTDGDGRKHVEYAASSKSDISPSIVVVYQDSKADDLE